MFDGGALSFPRQDGGMSGTVPIALSGLSAAAAQLQASASNVANMDDRAPLPGSGVAGPKPYAPASARMIDIGASGVQAQIAASGAGDSPSYAPDSAYADASGMVAVPNVDLGAEAAVQAQALQQYRLSAALLKTHARMEQAALDMLS